SVNLAVDEFDEREVGVVAEPCLPLRGDVQRIAVGDSGKVVARQAVELERAVPLSVQESEPGPAELRAPEYPLVEIADPDLAFVGRLNVLDGVARAERMDVPTFGIVDMCIQVVIIVSAAPDQEPLVLSERLDVVIVLQGLR